MALLFTFAGLLSIGFLVAAAGLFIRAWAITLLWAWFLVPIVPLLPLIGYAQALGLSLVLNTLITKPSVHNDSERSMAERIGEIAGIIIGPVFAVGVGWLIKYFG